MIKPLRKRHLQVWTLLAFLLPAGIFIAWKAVPPDPVSALLQPPVQPLLPVVVERLDKENYTVELRTNLERSGWQLQWINKSVLRFPTATLYRTDGSYDPLASTELIGRIEAKQHYVFPLKDTVAGPLYLLLYDFIHEKEIERIQF